MDHQSRPGIPAKKRRRDRLICWAATHPTWVLGWQDETWWSRLKQPMLHTWADEPWRLVEQTVATTDPDPQALACYGLLRDDTGHVLLRLVDGQPRGPVTIAFLEECCAQLAGEGKQALLLVWDNAC